MKHHDLEADTLLLLQELKPNDAPDVAVLSNVRQRVAMSLVAAQITASEPGKSAAGSPAAARHGASWFAASKGAAAALVALGTAFGAIGYSFMWPSSERVVYRDRFVAAASANVALAPPSAPPANSALPRAPQEPRGAEASPVRAASPSAPRPAAGLEAADLAAELRLIDKARTALAAGDVTTALSALRAHGARYAHGTMEQEREALWVKALVGAGRLGEARAASHRFAARYPNSTLLESVNAAVSTIP